LVQRMAREERNFNGGEGKGKEGRYFINYMFGSKEGRGLILIKNMFGSQEEWRDFKINLLIYP